MDLTILVLISALESFALNTIKSKTAIAKLKGYSGKIRELGTQLIQLADAIDAKPSLKKKK